MARKTAEKKITSTTQKKSKSVADIKAKAVGKKNIKSQPIISNGCKETSEKPRKGRKQVPEVKEISEEERKTGERNPSEAAQSEVETEAISEEAEEITPEVKDLKSVSEPIMKTGTNRKRKAVETVPKKSVEDKSSKVNKTKAKKQKFCIKVPPRRTVSGRVFVIGENDVGQLGLENVEVKKRPALLDLPQSVMDIAAGGMHSVCLTESGEVITFGCNDEGALGRLTTQEGSEFIPHRVEIPERIIQVSAGDSHSAALSESGQVYIWGNFRFGDGPVGLTRDGQKQTTPVRILTDETVVKIASGDDHLVCLSSGGSVYTLGRAENGQLGRVSERNCSDGGRKGLVSLLEPDTVFVSSFSRTIEEVWTGSFATFLRAHDTGSIWAFGLNNYNQLGYEEELSSFIPKKVPSFDNRVWNEISCGQHHTLALSNEGSVFSMGRKDYGMLGLGEGCTEKSSPTVIPTLENEKCTNISCGNCVSFAVTEQGSVFSWGFGDNHQLGHGDDQDCHVPKQIEGNFSKSWKALKVSGGGQHTLILACPRESTTTETTK